MVDVAIPALQAAASTNANSLPLQLLGATEFMLEVFRDARTHLEILGHAVA